MKAARFSPRALLVKRVARTLLRRKDTTPRMFEPIASERRVFDLDLCRGAARTGCWVLFVFVENILYEATGLSSLLRGARRRNRPTSRPPIKCTGLEIRADQAYRVQLIARSISFGCFIFGGAHVYFLFSLSVPSQSFILITAFLLQQYSSSLCCRQYLLKRRLFVVYKLSHCFT